jgi:hypothetical protein
MSKEHWIAVGSVSDAARQALIEADCFLHKVSATPQIVLVGRHYQDEHDLDIGWQFEPEIPIDSSGLHLFWYPSGGDCLSHESSVTETRLITADEWQAEREQEWTRAREAEAWIDELGDLDELPF